MKYYAIADLHGRFDLFKKSLSAIVTHAECKDHTIITLGDYIDRGPQSRQIIDGLIRHGFNDGSQYHVALQGNHEAMMLETILTPLEPSWWMNNGGWTTLNSYGDKISPYLDPLWKNVYMGVVPQEHLKFIGTMPIYFETEKQVFVHAGVPDNDLPLDKQDKEKMQWMLYGPQDFGGYKGKHVVHGHHQFQDGPKEFVSIERGGRIDLDTFAWKTGRIVVGVFDDTQGPAKEFLEVTI